MGRPASFMLNTKALALHRIWYPAGFFLLVRSLNSFLCEWFLSLRDSVFFDLISTHQPIHNSQYTNKAQILDTVASCLFHQEKKYKFLILPYNLGCTTVFENN